MSEGKRNGLEGKVALISGAGKGTGRALALAFAARGATVAANDLTPVNLDETLRQAAEFGGRIRPYLADSAKKMPVRALVHDVLADLGAIDILACCAEVEPRAALLTMDDWEWQRTLDVNLTGAFLLVQAAGREMCARGGTILLVGDRAAGGEKRAAYFASKAGLQALAQAADGELRAAGIRVHYLRAEPGISTVDLALSKCLGEDR
jgi:NAD(P)-dependent dehydrogenase (short-subunit alcohol dehydrogenase family)